jgi:hypothetical protein
LWLCKSDACLQAACLEARLGFLIFFPFPCFTGHIFMLWHQQLSVTSYSRLASLPEALWSLKAFRFLKIMEAEPGVVVHTYNPSYSGGGGRRIMSSRPA